MKKVKYGSNDNLMLDRPKSRDYDSLESLKDGDDDVCGAVLDTLSNDYLKYISDLVKGSKTPPKKHSVDKIEAMLKESECANDLRKPHRKAMLSN